MSRNGQSASSLDSGDSATQEKFPTQTYHQLKLTYHQLKKMYCTNVGIRRDRIRALGFIAALGSKDAKKLLEEIESRDPGPWYNPLTGQVTFKRPYSFDEGVQKLLSKVIAGTLSVHIEVTKTFRKTAAHFHYEFNMRHLANVFQGLLNADPTLLVTNVNVARLWVHECLRVFSDRLIDDDDRGWMRKQVSDVILPGAFKLNWKNVVEVRVPRLDAAAEAAGGRRRAERSFRHLGGPRRRHRSGGREQRGQCRRH